MLPTDNTDKAGAPLPQSRLIENTHNTHNLLTIFIGNIMETKVCSHCKRELPIENFYRGKDGRYQSWCKDCKKEEYLLQASESTKRRRATKEARTASASPIVINTYNIEEAKKIILKRLMTDMPDNTVNSYGKILGLSPLTVKAKMEELDSIDVSETYINREEKRLTDYTPRELLKALYDLGYEGTFYTYVRQENTLSHLFGDGKNK